MGRKSFRFNRRKKGGVMKKLMTVDVGKMNAVFLPISTQIKMFKDKNKLLGGKIVSRSFNEVQVKFNENPYPVVFEQLGLSEHLQYSNERKGKKTMSKKVKVDRVSILDALVYKELEKRNILLFDIYKKSKLTASKFITETKRVADNAPASLKGTAAGGLINFVLYMTKQLENWYWKVNIFDNENVEKGFIGYVKSDNPHLLNGLNEYNENDMRFTLHMDTTDNLLNVNCVNANGEKIKPNFDIEDCYWKAEAELVKDDEVPVLAKQNAKLITTAEFDKEFDELCKLNFKERKFGA